jgi:hypothetical protein
MPCHSVSNCGGGGGGGGGEVTTNSQQLIMRKVKENNSCFMKGNAESKRLEFTDIYSVVSVTSKIY